MYAFLTAVATIAVPSVCWAARQWRHSESSRERWKDVHPRVAPRSSWRQQACTPTDIRQIHVSNPQRSRLKMFARKHECQGSADAGTG
jgi:hypothetical protein